MRKNCCSSNKVIERRKNLQEYTENNRKDSFVFDERKIKVMQEMTLFYGLESDKIEAVLQCLQAKRKWFKKHTTIIAMGEKATKGYVILSGKVELSTFDIEGRKSIIDIRKEGDYFLGNFTFPSDSITRYQVIALKDSEFLVLDLPSIFKIEKSKCCYRNYVTDNLLRMMVEDNQFLILKNEILSQKTLRLKLLIYLQFLQRGQRSSCVSIPFNRTELADFLSADRSALSREIGNMVEEKILVVKNNQFKILQDKLISFVL